MAWCRFLGVVCLAALAVVVMPGRALAAASLSGQVTDATGAPLPGARVTATRVETSVSYPAVTNREGVYVVSSLPSGRYRVTVELSGFKTIVKPDVDIHVQDNVALNFAMEVGSVIESVTVEGGAPLVSMDPAVGTLVNRSFVENLPLNGRSFQSLIAVTPGVVLTRTTSEEQGQFSVNGQRADANYFMVDGVSANIGVTAGTILGQGGGGALPGLTAFGGTNNLVSIDALEEFRIETSTYAPEFAARRARRSRWSPGRARTSCTAPASTTSATMRSTPTTGLRTAAVCRNRPSVNRTSAACSAARRSGIACSTSCRMKGSSCAGRRSRSSACRRLRRARQAFRQFAPRWRPFRSRTDVSWATASPSSRRATQIHRR
jgi:hypothetical protein